VCDRVETQAGGLDHTVGSGAATVRSGLARAALPLLLEHEDPRRGGGAVLSVQLEGELRPAREGSVVAHARGMDRQTLGISVEVAGEDGSWREVASAKAIVRDGLARAELDLPPAKPG